jgi:hypothetical protein
MGLEVAAAAAGFAAGTARHLMQQLKGPLGGTRIAVASGQVGIHDADQIEPREWPSPPVGCR